LTDGVACHNAFAFYLDSTSLGIGALLCSSVVTRDVEAEAGGGSGGSGPFTVEAEARKFYSFCFHVVYLT